MSKPVDGEESRRAEECDSDDDRDDPAADDGESAESETNTPERNPVDDSHERVDSGVADDRADAESGERRHGADPG